jgi:hypothetical protein
LIIEDAIVISVHSKTMVTISNIFRYHHDYLLNKKLCIRNLK